MQRLRRIIVLVAALAATAGGAAAETPAPPPLSVPASPAEPSGDRWRGTVSVTRVDHDDSPGVLGGGLVTDRSSAVFVTAGDPTTFSPPSEPGLLVIRYPMTVAGVREGRARQYDLACTESSWAGSLEPTGASLMMRADSMVLERTPTSGGVLTFDLGLQAWASTTQRSQVWTGSETQCGSETSRERMEWLAGPPLRSVELDTAGRFAATFTASSGAREEITGSLITQGGRDVFEGVYVSTLPGWDLSQERVTWSLSCPVGTCITRQDVSGDLSSPELPPFEPTPLTGLGPSAVAPGGPAGAAPGRSPEEIARLLAGAGRSRGSGDLAIQCGKARFDWYHVTGRPAQVRKGDRVCVHVLSNELSRELWRLARGNGAALTQVYRQELLRAAAPGAVAAAVRAGALTGARKTFAYLVPEAARALGRTNMIFTAGKVTAYAGVTAGYLTALSKITRGRSCFGIVTVSSSRGLSVAYPRFVFGISDLKRPRTDADLSAFSTYDRTERRLRADLLEEKSLGVSCGTGGSALAGSLRDSGEVLSSPRRWVGGRATLAALGIPI